MAYSPSGHLVYLREGTLVAQPFDVTRLVLTSDAVRVAESVACYGPGTSAFSVSAEGTLVFREDAGWPEWQPVWLDRSGQELSTVGSSWPVLLVFRPAAPQMSSGQASPPDGRWLALTRRQPQSTPADLGPRFWKSTEHGIAVYSRRVQWNADLVAAGRSTAVGKGR